jgi:hypothetical protein
MRWKAHSFVEGLDGGCPRFLGIRSLNELIGHHDEQVDEICSELARVRGLFAGNPELGEDLAIAFAEGQLWGRRAQVAALRAFVETRQAVISGEIVVRTVPRYRAAS